MPVTVSKNPDGTYTVKTPNAVHSHHATLANAKAQARLLNAVDHGFVPTKGKKK